ncbi:hypothetical protein [uncultured Thiohalocapsa sp.]|uniref:hypothetical protein n=1 Tax=uncultured Thiohalocapsa sp. TaxID=768990 RepID=UPI0025E65883|nr:hypothetical protein [uncultured Thiohalocapsa sp.]
MRITPLMMLAAPSMLALTLTLGGCDQGEQTEQIEETAQSGEQQGAEPVAIPEDQLERAKAEAAAAMARLQEAGEQAGAAARNAAGSAMEQVQVKADEASASLREASAQASAAAAAAAEAASEQTAALTQSAQAQADSMITEVRDYLRENDLDSAQGVLDKLKALRDQVSAEVRTEIDALQKRLSEDESEDEAQNQPAG